MKTFALLLLLASLQAHATYGYKLKSYIAQMPGHFLVKGNDQFEVMSKAKALSLRHVSFMMGSLIVGTKYGTRASLSNNYAISNVVVTPAEAGVFNVSYFFSGTLIIEDDREIQNFKVNLPIYPEDLFKEADRKCATEFYYAGAEFVYFQFWDPTLRYCSQEEGNDYIAYPVSLEEIPATINTYPRYEELIHNNEVSFFYYFGSDDETMFRFGFSGKGFDSLKYWLKKKKFKQVIDPAYDDLHSKFIRYEKQMGNLKVTFKLMLGNPLPNTPEAQEEYFWFMKDAFENGSFVQYTGHAGHGAIMDLTALSDKFKAPVKFADRYQIYYLNGCMTYVYANDYFPRMKGGYKNLHLIGNGDYSWADVTWQSLITPLEGVLSYFEDGSRMSYQEMIDETTRNIDKALRPLRSGPMLTIVGDE